MKHYAVIISLFVTTLVSTGYAQNVVKQVVKFDGEDVNLLQAEGYRPYETGFQLENGVFVCDNGTDSKIKRGVMQSVTLNQTQSETIIAEAWSKAENVSGSPSADYSLYMDITYTDGTNLWGQAVAFATGTHDWQKKTLTILPQKPVRSLTVYTLFRNKSGQVAFRDIKLAVLRTPENACLFDGVPVVQKEKAIAQTFLIRDVAANSDYVELPGNNLGVIPTIKNDGNRIRVTLTNSDNKDRCLTLVYAFPIYCNVWYEHRMPYLDMKQNSEYVLATSMPNIGSNGRLSSYPFAAASVKEFGRNVGFGVGIDLKTPGFFRTGYNSGTQELFVAVDVALTKESPTAIFNFVWFDFDSNYGFRGALDAYYKIFPDYFASRTPEQGVWMPFASISKVPNHEDFGFKFKEGPGEIAWNKANGILTFRYTEPGTWWMPIPNDRPHNYDTALAEAKRLADTGNARALGFLKSGMHDADGKFVCQILDTPWNKGAVWSLNDMPEIEGGNFSVKWNPQIYKTEHEQKGFDGEYVDSAEAYVTTSLDFRRENFTAARTPLVFSRDGHQPAIFKGLVMFEYTRKIAEDMRKNNELTMANGTPDHYCWLAPWFDVMGTETDWNPGGRWTPMGDSAMLYRRAICGQKPFCFLMNTDFSKFTYEMSEKFMKRCLAYGMFPGYFSANASTGHYFERPELFERDRPLFKKYIPLCKLVAEAGWQPITLATSSDVKVYVERFGGGEKKTYFTVFNDSQEEKTVTLQFFGAYTSFKELVDDKTMTAENRVLRLTLPAEDVAVLEVVK